MNLFLEISQENNIGAVGNRDTRSRPIIWHIHLWILSRFFNYIAKHQTTDFYDINLMITESLQIIDITMLSLV